MRGIYTRVHRLLSMCTQYVLTGFTYNTYLILVIVLCGSVLSKDDDLALQIGGVLPTLLTGLAVRFLSNIPLIEHYVYTILVYGYCLHKKLQGTIDNLNSQCHKTSLLALGT